MEGFQLRFFILALCSVIFMLLIGVSVAEKNLLGMIASFILLSLTIGYGFILKKRNRNLQN